MRKLSMVVLSLSLLLSACAPNFQKRDEVVQENEEVKEKAIIPKYQISEQYYRTILPFKPSASRGLVVANLGTRYDINEFETGLMRLAQQTFSPEKYLFQEGQQLDRDTVKLWLNRKFTEEQLAKEGLEESQNIGLNPMIDNVVSDSEKHEQNKKNPKYLAHILEHNYLTKDKDDTVRLGGIVIGLALNSVYYYQTEKFGDTYQKKIAHETIVKEGKKIADQVVNRIRQTERLEDVPIMIALFEQESMESVVPGNFFAYGTVSKGKTSISEWENVKEEYFLFPSPEATDAHRDDVTFFLNFKQDVEEYFPNYNGVIGKAFYIDGQMQDLNITIPIQFYGKAEAVGFTQYVTGLLMEHFPTYISVQISVTSVNGPEALIVRKANQEEPFVHLYP